VSDVYQTGPSPIESLANAVNGPALACWLSTELGRHGVMDFVYDVCGLKGLRVDHSRKDGSAQLSCAATRDGLAAAGLALELAAWANCPAAWKLAENERLSRVEMAATRSKKPQANTEDINDR